MRELIECEDPGTQNDNWPIILVISIWPCLQCFQFGATTCKPAAYQISRDIRFRYNKGSAHNQYTLQSAVAATYKHCVPSNQWRNVSITELFHQIEFMLSETNRCANH